MPTLASWLNSLGWGISPNTNTNASPPPKAAEPEVPEVLRGFDVSTIQDIPKVVKAYRADTKGKFGGKDGLETRPLTFDAPTIYAHARALGHAETFGGPKFEATKLANIALMEGRSDFGNNYVFAKDGIYDVDPNQRGSNNLFQRLVADGLPDYIANFPVKVAEKARIAELKKVPFERAWNGMGVSKSGRSGKAYSDDIANGSYAGGHDRNKPLIELINRGLDDGRKSAKGSTPVASNDEIDSQEVVSETPVSQEVAQEDYADAWNQA